MTTVLVPFLLLEEMKLEILGDNAIIPVSYTK